MDKAEEGIDRPRRKEDGIVLASSPSFLVLSPTFFALSTIETPTFLAPSPTAFIEALKFSPISSNALAAGELGAAILAFVWAIRAQRSGLRT